MRQGYFSSFRVAAICGLTMLIAACQSVPQRAGFSAAQIAVLQQEGFKPVDDNWVLTLPNRLLFPSDQSELTADNLNQIAQMSRNLIQVGILTAVVEGHTDSTASDTYNLRLSQARAQTVAPPLIASGMTLSPEQIIGKGEAFPLSSNNTPEGRQDNRRVAIIISPM